MVTKKKNLSTIDKSQQIITPTYAARGMDIDIPRYKIPENELLPRTAYNIIHDELLLDGSSRLNLATFVTTWMEPEAKQLMSETFDKNMIDKDEYPQTAEIENRCVNMVANLYNSHEKDQACGCSTVGSSEACMLGGMALKWNWRNRMKAKASLQINQTW